MKLIYKMAGKLVAEGVTSATYNNETALKITNSCVGWIYFKNLIETTPQQVIIDAIKEIES
jgi:hypothetical protein